MNLKIQSFINKYNKEIQERVENKKHDLFDLRKYKLVNQYINLTDDKIILSIDNFERAKLSNVSKLRKNQLKNIMLNNLTLLKIKIN